MDEHTEKELQDILAEAEASGLAPDAAAAASPAAAGEQAETIQRLNSEIAELKDLMLRRQADFENIRKRLGREKEEFLQFSLFGAVEALLPILDNFELALNADGGGEEYRKGVELIYQQFITELTRMGLEPMSAAGESFDPNLHEAIATVETTEVPDQHVFDEIRRGYFFKQRLLRPARVRVAKAPE